MRLVAMLVVVVLMQRLLHLLLVLVEGVVAGAPVRAVVLHSRQDPLRPVLLAQIMLLADLTLVLLALHLACPQLQEVLVLLLLVFGLLEVEVLHL